MSYDIMDDDVNVCNEYEEMGYCGEYMTGWNLLYIGH